MHIMNMNIYFQISSEADLVLDQNVRESILLHECDAKEVRTDLAGSSANEEVMHLSSHAFGGE